jgi:hypothetical protein
MAPRPRSGRGTLLSRNGVIWVHPALLSLFLELKWRNGYRIQYHEEPATTTAFKEWSDTRTLTHLNPVLQSLLLKLKWYNGYPIQYYQEPSTTMNSQVTRATQKKKTWIYSILQLIHMEDCLQQIYDKSRLLDIIDNCFFIHIQWTVIRNITFLNITQIPRTRIKKMLEFLIDNHVVVSGQVFQQPVGFPMGSNCVPLLADLYLCSYEAEFIQKLHEKEISLAVAFNSTYRRRLSINNNPFHSIPMNWKSKTPQSFILLLRIWIYYWNWTQTAK